MAKAKTSGRKSSGGSKSNGQKRTEAATKAAAEKVKAQQEEKAALRKAMIEAGELIEGEDGIEFHRVNPEEKTKDTLDNRAKNVLEVLEESKTPVLGKELHERFGGSWALYIPMFSILKAQGLVVEYRRRTGERGGGGVAYLHTKFL